MPATNAKEMPKTVKGQIDFIMNQVEANDALRRHIVNILMDPGTKSAVKKLIKHEKREWDAPTVKYMHQAGTKWMIEILVKASELFKKHGALTLDMFNKLSPDRVERIFCWVFKVRRTTWLPHQKWDEADEIMMQLVKDGKVNEIDYSMLWTPWEKEGYVQLAKNIYSAQEMQDRGFSNFTVIALLDQELFINLPGRESDWIIKDVHDTNLAHAFSRNAGSENGKIGLRYHFWLKYSDERGHRALGDTIRIVRTPVSFPR